MSRFILLLSIIVFLGACSASDSTSTEALSIEIVQPSDSGNDAFQIVSLQVGKHKVFAEDGPVFIDIPTHNLETAKIDSVRYFVGDTTFARSSVQPLLLTFRGKLETAVKLNIYQDGALLTIPGTSNNTTKLKVYKVHPLIEKDAIVFGLLVLVLVLIFYTSQLSSPSWKKFYTYIPALLLCYFIPATLNSLNIINGEYSDLYSVAKNYFLPASLVLLCLSIDLKGILNLGPKALIMFFTATLGVVIGGPLALLIVSSWTDIPNGVSADAVWRGLSTVAGSWIGGGANQTAMKEISNCTDTQFSGMIVVDVFVANIWMAFLLFGAGITVFIDKKLKSDTSSIDALRKKMEHFQSSISKVPTFTDLMVIAAIAFVGVAAAHFLADIIAPGISKAIAGSTYENYLKSFGSGFFWLIILATFIGVGLSFTKLKKYEGAGSSKFGSIFIYLLVATIGMKMDIPWLIDNWSKFSSILLIGLIWMGIHIILLLTVAKIIKAPFFYVAVGSQANIGGAASAPIVASAFSPSLAPVGVLLAVLGYAVGTIAAVICMELMQLVS